MSLRGGLARAGRHVRSHPPRAPLLSIGRVHSARAFWSWSGPPPPAPPPAKLEPFTSNARNKPTVERYRLVQRPFLVQQFDTAVGTHDAAAVHRWYGALREVLVAHPPAPGHAWLTRAQLLGALALLATTARALARNTRLLDTLLADMPALHHTPVGEDVHAHILAALLRDADNLELPHAYVASMHERPGGVAPTAAVWDLLLAHCAKLGKVGMIRRVLADMATTGCAPTLRSYQLLFDAIDATAELPTTDEAAEIVQQMVAAGLKYSPSTWGILQDAYIKQDFRVQADEIRDLYEQAYSALTPKTGADLTPLGLTQELTQCAVAHGVDAALELWKARSGGARATFDTLAAVLRGSHKLTELRRAERALRVRAGPNARVWMLLLRNADARCHAHNAVEIYTHAQRAGVAPTAALAMPAIHVLCAKADARGGDAQRADDARDTALELYRGLCAAPAGGGPSPSVYRALVRTLVHAPDTARYAPVLHELLAEMAARRLALDPVLRAAVVTLAMRGAGPDPAAAHAAYEAATRGAPPLDAPGYRHVLREFCALAGAPPPLALVFELVADARAAGHDLGADAYVAWLRAVGRRASAVRARGERPEAEQAALRTAHDRLALDATVTPRAALWAALMDAYQRAGLVRDALRVWDAVQLAGALSDAAVAVVLDTCAHAGICSFMLEAWARLVRTRYPLTRRHWNGLAEALCRLGRLERALSVVSVEMGALGDPELAPDVESVRILAKFSKAHGRYEEVEGVLRTRLPELWKEYEENME